MTWVGRAWWELRLLPDWKATDETDCLTITRSDDGAFQLSGAVKTAGAILLSELEEMCREEVPNNAVQMPCNFGQFQGVAASYLEEGILWQKFWLAHRNLLVYATYNGCPSTWQQDGTNVLSMLGSLRVIPSANTLRAFRGQLRDREQGGEVD